MHMHEFVCYESRLQKLHVATHQRLFCVLVLRMMNTRTDSRPGTFAELPGRMFGTRNMYFVHCKISLYFEYLINHFNFACTYQSHGNNPCSESKTIYYPTRIILHLVVIYERIPCPFFSSHPCYNICSGRGT